MLLFKYNSGIRPLSSIILIVLLVNVWLFLGQTYPGGLLVNVPLVRFLTYIIIGMCVPVYLIIILQRKSIHRHGGSIYNFAIVMLLYMLFIVLYNNDSLTEYFQGVFVYLRYTILFAMLALVSNKRTLQQFIKIYLVVSLLVGAEALINYLILGLRGDNTFLTLGPRGGHVAAGVLLLYAACFAIAHMYIRTVNKYHNIMFVVLVIVALVIASNRGAVLLLLPLTLLVYLIKCNTFNLKFLYLFSIVINVLVVVASVHFYRTNGWIDVVHDINPIFRLNYIGGVYDLLVARGDILFGNGIRSMQPGPGGGGGGGAIHNLLYAQYRWLQIGGTNQYVKSLAELGVIGSVLYWLMLSKILADNIKVWTTIRFKHDIPVFDKSVSLSFFAIWLHFSAIGLFYNDFWRFDASALIFWSFALYLYFVRLELNRK